MRDTLIRVRDARFDNDRSSGATELPTWLTTAGAGAGAALGSAILLVVVTVLAWLTGAGGSESAGATVAAGLAGWAFAHGAPLALGEGRVGLIPWLLTAWPLLVAWWSARRLVHDGTSDSPRLRGFGGVRQDVARSVGLFVAGYTLTGLVLAVMAHLGGARPSLLLTVVGCAVVAVTAYGLAAWPRYRGRGGDLAPRIAWAWREYVPDWAARAVRPTVMAVALTLLAGTVTVLVAVVVGFSSVVQVYGWTGGGVVGAVLLTLAQLAYLPTLAMWGVSWLAGSGFSLGSGTSVTWFASTPGAIPLVPVLAAVPAPGPLPGWTPVVVLVPVAVGAWLGWRCRRRAATPGPDVWRTTGVAVLLYGMTMAVLAGAASGPVGARRLEHVGPDPVVTALCLTGEIAVGAALAVGLAGLRVRRTREADAPDGLDPIDGSDATAGTDGLASADGGEARAGSWTAPATTADAGAGEQRDGNAAGRSAVTSRGADGGGSHAVPSSGRLGSLRARLGSRRER